MGINEELGGLIFFPLDDLLNKDTNKAKTCLFLDNTGLKRHSEASRPAHNTFMVPYSTKNAHTLIFKWIMEHSVFRICFIFEILYLKKGALFYLDNSFADLMWLSQSATRGTNWNGLGCSNSPSPEPQ